MKQPTNAREDCGAPGAAASAASAPAGFVCGSARLTMRRANVDDADFIVELLNDPDWIEFIGNRNVHSRDDGRRWIETKLQTMVARHGFSLDVVERKLGRIPIGICGLIKRDTLDDVDLGFAFLPAWRGMGYAREASVAVLEHGMRSFALPQVAAITSKHNLRSIKLLESLGFAFQRALALTPGEPDVNFYLRKSGAG